MKFSSNLQADGGMLMRDIRKVAVLGAGTMGARIAAHLANASVPCLLLDIIPKQLTPEEQAKGLALDAPQVRNRLARAGLDAALKSRPAAFFVPEAARLITLGNFEDDLAGLKDCDWIIEAVMEDLAVKRALLERIQAVRSPGAIVSSNTSGISISSLSVGCEPRISPPLSGHPLFQSPALPAPAGDHSHSGNAAGGGGGDLAFR